MSTAPSTTPGIVPTTATAYAAPSPKAPLERTTFSRRPVGEHDVAIEIAAAGPRPGPGALRSRRLRGHRTIQAGSGFPGREETRRPVTDHGHGPPARTRNNQRTRATSAPKTVRDARSDGQWVQASLLLTD
jgi:hypothetical protein